ncbi:MAG: 50S ribosomal protein L4 [Gammaproteobacteria bacterium]|nr:50S ribosomal protein L4 [Gammaproteobacteria bacterium]
MNISLHGSSDNIEVNDGVFGSEYREALVHQVLSTYIRRGHTGTRKQKNRADVRGGGAKPWRQKGTGRARAGSRTSPIWQGGGVTFAAQPVKRQVKLNRKMYQGAMRCLLSELVRQDRVSAVANLPATDAKTKHLVAALNELELTNVLLVDASENAALAQAARNLNQVEVLSVAQLNPVSLMKCDHVLFSVDGIRRCEESLV